MRLHDRKKSPILHNLCARLRNHTRNWDPTSRGELPMARPKGSKNRPKPPGHTRKLPEFISSGVGTAHRLQHGDLIVRDPSAFATDHGQFAHPFRNVDILERWSKGNPPDITPEMRTAGDEFRTMFRIARMDQLMAASLEPVITGSIREDPMSGPQYAVNYVRRVLRLLGGVNSPCGSCVWHVLGEGLSLQQYAKRCGWSGRSMHLDAARGLLIGALGTMAADSFGAR